MMAWKGISTYIGVFIFIRVLCVFGFKCYLDECEAGYQYCVPERERCFHCKDLKEPCGNTTIHHDCNAYCVHVSMVTSKVRLENTVHYLRNQKAALFAEAQKCVTELKETRENRDILTARIHELSEVLKSRDGKIKDLDMSNKVLKENTGGLNTSLINITTENQKLVIEVKDLNTEVAIWKAVSATSVIAIILTISICLYLCQSKKSSENKYSGSLSPENFKLLDDKTHNERERTDMKEETRFPSAVVIYNIQNGDDTRMDTRTPKEEIQKRRSQDSAVGSESSGSDSSLDEKGVKDTKEKQTGPARENLCGCGHPDYEGVRNCACIKGINPTTDSTSVSVPVVCGSECKYV